MTPLDRVDLKLQCGTNPVYYFLDSGSGRIFWIPQKNQGVPVCPSCWDRKGALDPFLSHSFLLWCSVASKVFHPGSRHVSGDPCCLASNFHQPSMWLGVWCLQPLLNCGVEHSCWVLLRGLQAVEEGVCMCVWGHLPTVFVCYVSSRPYCTLVIFSNSFLILSSKEKAVCVNTSSIIVVWESVICWDPS